MGSTLFRKEQLDSKLQNSIIYGWLPVGIFGGSWIFTRTSYTGAKSVITFNDSMELTSYIEKGMKIRWKQNGSWRYALVIGCEADAGLTHTEMTIIGTLPLDSSYVVSDVEFSREEKPFGYNPQFHSMGFDATLVSDQSVPSGSWTVIEWDAVYHDYGGNYNSANGKFIAPCKGLYHFDCTFSYNASVGNWVQAQFATDSSISTYGRFASSIQEGSNATKSGSRDIFLDEGEYVDIQVYQNTGSNLAVKGTRGYGGFSGHLVDLIN